MRTGKWQHWLGKFLRTTSLVLSGTTVAASGNTVFAQIIPDNTLGAESSVVIPNININDLPADHIAGGATRGVNLFHSFLEFNVSNGQRVYFANPTGIENILSRVTGTNPSEIFGTLGVNGGANLFFLNPNGIILGEDATLDIRGSFTATTANSFTFPDGNEFSASNPQAPPLLKINVPIGLQYGQPQPGAIANRGNLAVGQDLTLSAGEVTSTGQLYAPGGEVVVEGVSGNVQVQYLEAQTATLSAKDNLILQESQLGTQENLTLLAEDTVQVRDSAANPFIAATGGELLIQGNREVDIFALNHPDSGLFSLGDMVLRSANPVGGDAHYWSGSSFRIEQLDGSLGDLFSLYDPIIRSEGDVRFEGYRGTSLHILAGGQVEFDTVVITAPGLGNDTINPTETPMLANVTLSDGTPIVIDGSRQPTLDVRAGMNPAAIGNPGITDASFPPLVNRFLNTSFRQILPPPGINPVATSADITIGNVRILAPDGLVLLTNQYQPNPLLPGGDITLTKGDVFGFGIDARGFMGNNGSAVILDSRQDITLENGTSIISSGSNNAGDISFLAQNNITFDPGSRAQAISLLGEGGNITFNSGDITLGDGTFVLSTGRQGNAGDISFLAQNNITFEPGSRVQANSLSGEGGNITFNSGDITLGDGTFVISSALRSKAGDINFLTQNNITFHPGSLVQANGLFGGNIAFKSGDITLGEGTSIRATGLQGKAGDINFLAQNDIIFHPGSRAQANSLSGEGGNITFKSGDITLGDGTFVISSALKSKAGDINFLTQNNITLNPGSIVQANGLLGGNLTFKSGGTISANDSVVISRNFTDVPGLTGGSIKITADSLTFTDETQLVTYSNGKGNAGNVTINVQNRAFFDRGGLVGSIVDREAEGNSGEVKLTAESLALYNGALLVSWILGDGKGGNLTVEAADIELIGTRVNSGRGGFLTESRGGKDSSSGDITVITERLLVQDGAQISASTRGQGEGGNVQVDASDSLEVAGTGIGSFGQTVPSYLFTVTTDDGINAGNAGNLTVNTGQLIVRDGAIIGATSFSSGQGGSLTVNAESILLSDISADGTIPSSLSTDTFSTGDGGELLINTGRLTAQNGAGVSAASLGEGEGGRLTINARELVELRGTAPNGFPSGLSVQALGAGNGGDLRIVTDVLRVDEQAIVTAASGNAADARIPTGQFIFDRPIIFPDNATGDGGDLNITARVLSLNNGGQVTGATTGEGQGGIVTVHASDLVEIVGVAANGDPSRLTAFTRGTGDAGNLNVFTTRLKVQDGGEVSADTSSTGLAGTLMVDASESVEVIGTSANGNNTSSLFFDSSGAGDAGELIIDTSRLLVQDGGKVSAATSSTGQGGTLRVNATESVEVIGTSADGNNASSLFFDSSGAGNAGELIIDTSRLLVQDGGRVSAATSNTGQGGTLEVDATESVEVIGTSADGNNASSLFFDSSGAGNAGKLTIDTNRLLVQDGGRVSAATSNTGQGGTLRVDATESVEVIGTSADGNNTSSLFFDSSGAGDAGKLTISTNRLLIRNGGQVSAATSAEGRGGVLEVNDSESVEVIGTSADGNNVSSLFFDSSGAGNAGKLTIDTNRLLVQDGGRVSAATSNTGQGGTLEVDASESVEVIGTSADGNNTSSLFFDSSGAGNAGKLTIDTSRLLVQDGGRVSAATSNTGQGGTLEVDATESVEVIGTSADGNNTSSLFFDSSGAGDAGELTIDTSRLLVQDGGRVSAATSNTGQGGTLEVDATESVEVIGTSADGNNASSLFFDSSGAGDAGELTIGTSRLLIRDGGQVSAATSAEGRGGVLEVNASESVEVSGTSPNNEFASGLFFDSRGAGDARGINLNTGDLTVQNGGQITVSGSGTGISGDLEVTAESISLTNQGSLRATTTAAEGGNIKLKVANSIILRHNSEIVAEAFGTANGGNITIDAGGFVLAILSENSDVVANAFEGEGGKIFVKAAGVFAFRQFQDRRTPESDLTASSELGIDGTVEINTQDTPDFNLPIDFAEEEVQQICPSVDSQPPAQFYSVGRQGLPTNPYESLDSVTIWEDLQPPRDLAENLPEQPERIVEATGWVVTEKGEVIWVAQMPSVASQRGCRLR
ncbi:MAG: filamentous hemagglutinin N-terminal domain-containing protein [Symploca sp. SIO1A3]|nr:filamentous hemagglutinin N-terminal domain-containing protein [Symploca sp. SIO1A3]